MRALLAALALACWAAASSAAGEAFPGSTVNVEGKIVTDGEPLPPESEVRLTLETGKVLVTFPDANGRFSLVRVPDGTHTLDVVMPKFLFPAVKVVTAAGVPNPVTASAPEIPMAPTLPYPLLLRPIMRAEYFETRKPINILAYLKTPYGMMAAFMVFSMFIMPKLKVDPEEYRRVMEESRGQGGTDNSERRRD